MGRTARERDDDYRACQRLAEHRYSVAWHRAWPFRTDSGTERALETSGCVEAAFEDVQQVLHLVAVRALSMGPPRLSPSTVAVKQPSVFTKTS